MFPDDYQSEGKSVTKRTGGVCTGMCARGGQSGQIRDRALTSYSVDQR